jgi:lipopolysaccharide exporter
VKSVDLTDLTDRSATGDQVASTDRAGDAPTNLTVVTVRSLLWTYGSTGVLATLQLGYTAAISRLLLPADFGLIALASLPLALSSHVAGLGIASAIVQKRALDDRDVRVAFTGSAALGVLAAVAIALVAPAVGWVFARPDLVPVLQALGLSYAIAGFGGVALALLRRNMRFRAVAAVEISSYAVGYPVVGIVAAAYGWGVWSLVVASLTQSTVQTAGALVVGGHGLRPLFDRRRAHRIFGFGSLVSVNGMLEMVTASADTYAVGRYLGAAALGQYNRATLLVGLPMTHLSTGATKVLMPGFSRITDDVDRTRSAYLRGLALLTGVLFPFAVTASVLAGPLVTVMLGEGWETAAHVLPVVAFAVTCSFAQHLGAVVCEARGRVARKLVIQCGYLTVVIVAVAAVVLTGPTVIRLALVFAAGQLLQHVLYQVQLRADLAVPVRTLVGVHVQSLALAAASGTAAALAASFGGPPLVRLGAGVFAAVAVWAAAVAAIRPLRIRSALAALDLGTQLRRH